jgi:serine/threonine protein kinase
MPSRHEPSETDDSLLPSPNEPNQAREPADDTYSLPGEVVGNEITEGVATSVPTSPASIFGPPLCPGDVGKLNSLSEPDTLVGMLRQVETLDDPAAKEVGAQLVERLSKIRPEPSSQPADAGAPAGPAPSEVTVDQQPSKEQFDFLAPAQQFDEIGRLGGYRVLEVLGAGGMGVVFRAEDPQLARMVALKAMLPGSIASETARQRFLREARAAAAFKDDHIVSIYQVGEDCGILYLAMELLEGEPLDARLRRDIKLSAAEVARIGRQIAAALSVAHNRGMLHRDIKPANIWLESETNRVKILDFGLARGASESAMLTQQGAIVGTPAYMAPEQAKGKELDHRCDLFSLGCVLYRMATGQAPFRGADVVSTLLAVSTETPKSPQALEPGLPRALSDLIVSLLAKEPADRPASAQAVAAKLDHIAQELSRPAPTKPRRRWPAIAAVAGFLTLLLAGLVIFKTTWLPGRKTTVAQDGALIGEKALELDSKPEKVLPVRTDPDRAVAEWVVSSGGFVVVRLAKMSEKKTLFIVDKSQPAEIRKQPDGKSGWGADEVILTPKLPPGLLALSRISFHKRPLNDEGLSHLAPAKGVLWLNLDNTAVTDAGLVHLKGM